VDALRDVGAARSIVIDEANVIRAGNGVVEAAAEAGIAKLRVVDADGDEIIAVRRRGLSPEQLRRLAMYDNRSGEFSTWDPAQLRLDAANGLDLKPFFFEEELAELVGPGAVVHRGKTDPDATPEVRATTIQRGDLFDLGEHRLLCGDSAKLDDVRRLMQAERAALVATDPPYGVNYASLVAGRGGQKRGGWTGIEGDAGIEGLDALLREAFTAARTVAADGCAVLVWHPSGENYAIFRDALIAAGVHILKQIVWVKPSLVFGRHEYHYRHEPAMYGWFEGSRANFYGERSETTVWEIGRSDGTAAQHPTQKPVELFARPIRNHSQTAEVIYEPFAGSGSAVIAAEQTHRRARAMEIEPSYCQVIIDRWEAFTEQRAVKVGEAA